MPRLRRDIIEAMLSQAGSEAESSRLKAISGACGRLRSEYRDLYRLSVADFRRVYTTTCKMFEAADKKMRPQSS